ncbi:MAG: hypothetical protein ACP5EP_11920 [Acidobacteriaceae bacterium]
MLEVSPRKPKTGLNGPLAGVVTQAAHAGDRANPPEKEKATNKEDVILRSAATKNPDGLRFVDKASSVWVLHLYTMEFVRLFGRT